MERVNGYLVIDDCRREVVDEEKGQGYVYIDDEEWYFKPILSEEIIYNELVACNIARLIGVECCYYDLATLNGVKGVISRSFRKNGDKLVAAEVILGDYLLECKDVLVNLGFDRIDADIIIENYHKNGKYEGIDEFNTLEALELALRYKYNDKFDIDKVIVQVKKMFIFDILVNQSDRHTANYIFIINMLGIGLAPIFDNSYAFREFGCWASMSVCFDDLCSTTSKLLKTFLESYSHKDFILFLSLFTDYVRCFSKAILMTERQIERALPDKYKDVLFKNANDNVSALFEVLRDYCRKMIKINGVSSKKYSVKTKRRCLDKKPLFKMVDCEGKLQ